MKNMKILSMVLVVIMAMGMLSLSAFAAEEAACAHENLQTIPAVAATCCTDGHTEGKTCIDCGDTVQQLQTISATGEHDIQDLPGVAATCDEDGKTDGQICNNSGDTIVKQLPIPALGHTWDEGIEDDGVMVYTCTVCGETKTEAVEKPPVEESPAPSNPPVEDDEDEEDKPVAPPAGGDSGKTESPKTGDHTVAFFFVGMVTILMAAVMVVFASKKSKSEK